MNRRERRRSAALGREALRGKGKKFVAKCQMCEKDVCDISVIVRDGKKDLAICAGCPCSVEPCHVCGQTGRHWLGCKAVGLPEKHSQPPPA